MNDEQVVFDECMIVQQPNDMRMVSVIDTIDDDVDAEVVPIKERLVIEALVVVILNFESDGI